MNGKAHTHPSREDLAKQAGLRYVNDFEVGLTRRRCGRGFTYLNDRGQKISQGPHRKRIEALVIPPAWEEVWICKDPRGHIQATGRDSEGRKQYIYHPDWQTHSGLTKFHRMHLMPEVLPRIRRRVRKDLEECKLSKTCVSAAVVRLMDKSFIRIGNEQYAKERDSHGATTLTHEHVKVDGVRVSLDFPGKSGQHFELEISAPRVARIIEACGEIEGQYLFCYPTENGEIRPITSTDVNEYLQEISAEEITAKDFRTWWGSVTAFGELARRDGDLTKTERKKAAVEAVAETASLLNNTAAVCKKYYIHPGLLSHFLDDELTPLLKKAEAGEQRSSELSVNERRFANLLPLLDHPR